MPPVITPAALQSRLADPAGIVVLDVRRRAAFEADPWLIPGALWRDPDRTVGWAVGLPRGRQVIVYCAEGKEPGRGVVQQLLRLGHDSCLLEGGIAAWRAAGGALVGEDKPVVVELARRAAMLDAVSFAATRLIGQESWQAGVEELLNRLGEATDVTRVTLFEAHTLPDGQPVQSCRHDWASPGWDSISSDPRYQDMPLIDVATGELEEWTQRRQRGEIVQATLRDVAGYSRQVFEEHGTLSFISVPIMVGGKWWGFIGFDDCVVERAWTDLEIEVLKTAAALIGGAIEHAQAAERLRVSEELLRTVTHDAPVMLCLTDADDLLVFANRPYLEFCGRRIEEVVGRGWEQTVHRDDLPAVLEQSKRDHAERRPHEIEYRMRRVDGEMRWVRERAMPRLTSSGAFIGFVSAIADITERKAAESEIVRQREALYQSEKLSAMGSLLAGVAHELNNPLSVVVGQVQLLEETVTEPAVLERARKILAAAHRCAKIVKTFLAMARRRPPERREVSLNAVIDSALEVVGYGLRTAGVEVTLDLAPDLPAFSADSDQLHQVVMNLVVNAQHALETVPAPRRLRIATAFDRATGQLRLTVTDNGPGISAEIRSRIFEPFFTTKPAGVGTGVGLPLCLGIVEAHGGRMAIEDAPGRGASVLVLLPYVAPLAEPEQAAPGPVVRPGLHILVVDDEVEIADTLAEILARDGHRADIVDNGAAALERLGRHHYDLVLSDLRMPGLDGAGIYGEIVRRHARLAARTVFITGDMLSDSARRFLAASGRPALHKPFDAVEVRRVVAEVAGAAAQDSRPGTNI
jgi:PAS domain S-box-containing protein